MKKKISILLFTLVVATSFVACGSSGVSQEEYDKVVAERDELQAQLDALTGESSEEDGSGKESDNGQQEYKIGDTWEVDGIFRVTVNSVVATEERNQFEETNPSAVYIITYTYENLGLNDELYVSLEDKIVDASGKMGSSYPGNIDKYPQSIPVGAYCEAQACISVDNPGNFKNYVSIYDDEYNEYTAIFNLEIQ